MEIKQITKWDEAWPHLDMIAGTVINDVLPLLQTPGGAPHTVSREVCSYVDYLGALYVGTPKGKLGNDGLAQVGLRFKQYLMDVMSLTDSQYKAAAEVIYQMYRNGPVHEFDPKVLKNKSGQVLAWFEYRGPRDDVYKELNMKVRHMEATQDPRDPNVFYLPASTVCLIQDLLNSIEHFKGGLGKPNALVAAWNESAAILSQPRAFEFTIPLRS